MDGGTNNPADRGSSRYRAGHSAVGIKPRHQLGVYVDGWNKLDRPPLSDQSLDNCRFRETRSRATLVLAPARILLIEVAFERAVRQCRQRTSQLIARNGVFAIESEDVSVSGRRNLLIRHDAMGVLTRLPATMKTGTKMSTGFLNETPFPADE